MPPIHLQKVVPDQNMARFYRIEVAPTLFGETSVHRSWGRIGTRGRTMIETCPSNKIASACASRLARAKLRRGYAENS